MEHAPGKVRLGGIPPGALIWWRGMDGVERGPALARGTFQDGGETWVWFRYGQTDWLLNAKHVGKVRRCDE
jgi:hypothetical protein